MQVLRGRTAIDEERGAIKSGVHHSPAAGEHSRAEPDAAQQTSWQRPARGIGERRTRGVCRHRSAENRRREATRECVTECVRARGARHASGRRACLAVRAGVDVDHVSGSMSESSVCRVGRKVVAPGGRGVRED